MAKKENPYKGYGINTQAIHTGTDYDQETGAVRRPLHMANSYKLPDDLSKVNYSSTDLLMYSRNGNANQHWLEEKIAALHEANDAIVLASGVGALHALFWTLLKTGDRVVYPKVSYMAVYRMFHELFNRKFGVETVMVDMTDLDEVKKAITPGTRLVHIETPDNPTNGVSDIEAIARIAHENGALLSVDNTFASPLNQKPLQLGADFVVEALTKFINGHGDAQGGAVISNDLETMDRIRYEAQVNVGAVISPFNAWILLQGLETLSLRVERHAYNTKRVVDFLSNHPKVQRVNHPQLSSHPDHQLYTQLFPHGGGSIFTIEVKGGEREAWTVIDNLKIFSLLANVADVKSLVIHPYTTTHSQLTPQELEEQHIYPNTIRLSIGTEHVDDIIDDLSQALEKI